MFIGFFEFLAPVVGGLLGDLFAPKPKVEDSYQMQNKPNDTPVISEREQTIQDAKDAARFRTDLDKEMGNFSFGLRDKEAEGNFGRQFKLDTQNRQFDRDINTDTQTAMGQRLDRELANRLAQQDRGINQENFATNRAIRLASRRLGSR
jgi:hypothetical protein